MELAGVLLLVNNWRSVLLCSLLLASKVQRGCVVTTRRSAVGSLTQVLSSAPMLCAGLARLELLERRVLDRVPSVLSGSH